MKAELKTGRELSPSGRKADLKVHCVLFRTVFFVPSVRQWDGILGPALRAGTIRAAPGAHAVSPGRRARDGQTLCAVTSAVTAATTAWRRLGGMLPPRHPAGPRRAAGGGVLPGRVPAGDVIVPRKA